MNLPVVMQLAGRLVRLAQVYQNHFTMPIVSRTFAAVNIKGLLVELELLPEMRVIEVKMYAKNATGLLGQVLLELLEMGANATCHTLSPAEPAHLILQCTGSTGRSSAGICGGMLLQVIEVQGLGPVRGRHLLGGMRRHISPNLPFSDLSHVHSFTI